jgi:hypothetical protein
MCHASFGIATGLWWQAGVYCFKVADTRVDTDSSMGSFTRQRGLAHLLV